MANALYDDNGASLRGAPNGYAGLDAEGLVPVANLPVSGALPELLKMAKSPVDDADITAVYSAMIFRQYTIADGKTLTLRDGSDFAIL